jgi:hypothetical protein
MDFAYRLIKPMSGIEMFAPDGFLSVILFFSFSVDCRHKPFSSKVLTYHHVIEYESSLSLSALPFKSLNTIGIGPQSLGD